MSNESARDPNRDLGLQAVMALKAALPTSRHADTVVDGVLAGLGDDLIVETANERKIVVAFRRDRGDRQWVVPWPIMRFGRGPRIIFPLEFDGFQPAEPPPRPVRRALRLRGLGPGEFEISDGRFHASVSYEEDGRQFETERGGPNASFADIVETLRRGGQNGVDAVADYVMSLDPGLAGPGRLWFPPGGPVSVQSAWNVGLNAIRDALLNGRIPADDTWAAADGLAGTVVCGANTRADVIARCQAEIQRVRPCPAEPAPMPELSEETLASLGVDAEMLMIRGPTSDAPPAKPTPENTPMVVVEVATYPTAASPLGGWFRLVNELGAPCVAAMRRNAAGMTLVSLDALAWIDPQSLDQLLDAADGEADLRLRAHAARERPAELPPLTSTATYYRLNLDGSGKVVAFRGCVTQSPGFIGRQIRPDEFESGVMRQRWMTPLED